MPTSKTPLKACYSPLEILLLLTISITFCCAVVYFSVRYGRLSIPLQYDDIVYHYDAVKRLAIYRDSGLLAFIRSFGSHNDTGLELHAPASSLLSIAGFIIFGVKDWAPYILNSGYLFLTLIFVYYLTAKLPALHRVPIYIFTLGTPFVILMLTESRPDMGAGLVNSVAILLVLKWGISSAPLKKIIFALLVAITMLIKPTMALFSISLISVAVLIKLIESVCIDYSKTHIEAFKWILAQLIITLIIISPYAYFHGADRAAYILQTLIEDKSMWGLDASQQHHRWRMYLDQLFGYRMFNQHFWLISGIFLLGSIALFRQKSKRLNLLSLLLCSFFAWLIPTYFSKANPFFASTFYYLALLGAIYLLSHLLIQYRNRTVLTALMIGLLSLSPLLSKRVVLSPFSVSQDFAQKQHRLVNSVVSSIEKIGLEKDKSIRLFFTGQGVVSHHLINYKILKHASPYELIRVAVFADDLELSIDLIEKSTAVLAFDSGVGFLYANTNFPSHKNMEAILNHLQSNNYKLLEQFPIPDQPQKYLYLYERQGTAR